MKTFYSMISIALLLCISSNIHAQRVIKNDAYEIVYSEVYEQPISVKYDYPDPMTSEYRGGKNKMIAWAEPIQYTMVQSELKMQEHQVIAKSFDLAGGRLVYIDKNGRETTVRLTKDEDELITMPAAKKVTIDTVITRKVDFVWQAPKGVKTSDSEDYEMPYDHAHMTPLMSQDSTHTDDLWSYINCALMHSSLKDGVWKEIEEKELEISKSAMLTVSIIPSFNSNSKLTRGGATIPTHFTKILEYKKLDSDEKEARFREVYCFPNDYIGKWVTAERYKIKDLSY